MTIWIIKLKVTVGWTGFYLGMFETEWGCVWSSNFALNFAIFGPKKKNYVSFLYDVLLFHVKGFEIFLATNSHYHANRAISTIFFFTFLLVKLKKVCAIS